MKYGPIGSGRRAERLLFSPKRTLRSAHLDSVSMSAFGHKRPSNGYERKLKKSLTIVSAETRIASRLGVGKTGDGGGGWESNPPLVFNESLVLKTRGVTRLHSPPDCKIILMLAEAAYVAGPDCDSSRIEMFHERHDILARCPEQVAHLGHCEILGIRIVHVE